jgi:hypothetical protein
MAIEGKRILALAPRWNSAGRKDATGAFQPEALAFAARHEVPRGNVVWIDNRLSRPAMREAVLAQVARVREEAGVVEALALFCHGLTTRIQFGFGLADAGALAAALGGFPEVRVALYACNAARGAGADVAGGDGGFADRLRDALCETGAVDCQVDAHGTAGHTTWNPFVRRFQGMGSAAGGVGGFHVVSPSHKALFRKWRTALRTTPLRFDFPFLSVAEIHERIAG